MFFRIILPNTPAKVSSTKAGTVTISHDQSTPAEIMVRRAIGRSELNPFFMHFCSRTDGLVFKGGAQFRRDYAAKPKHWIELYVRDEAQVVLCRLLFQDIVAIEAVDDVWPLIGAEFKREYQP